MLLKVNNPGDCDPAPPHAGLTKDQPFLGLLGEAGRRLGTGHLATYWGLSPPHAL